MNELSPPDSPRSGGLTRVAIAFGVHLPLARAAAFFWATSAKSIFLACTISVVEFFTSAHLHFFRIHGTVPGHQPTDDLKGA